MAVDVVSASLSFVADLHDLEEEEDEVVASS
jgi:hypothetical protein